MKEITTTDLAEYGWSEVKEAARLLNAWINKGLPKEFYVDEIRVMLNKNSGYVFLTNSEFQCAMMNGDNLEIWHSCPNCGNEGFQEDCKISDCGQYCCSCNPNEIES